MKEQWTLENQLNNEEIDSIMENSLDDARELVILKKEEADIYITYLRKEADRLEGALELLDIRLEAKKGAQNHIRQEQVRAKNSKILNARRYNSLLGRLSKYRQNLLNKPK